MTLVNISGLILLAKNRIGRQSDIAATGTLQIDRQIVK